jgi:hypothetical protein
MTPTSTYNKRTKVKRLREDRFCVFLLFFCLGFVLWWVLFLCFIKLKKIFSTKNVIIIFKLSTIDKFTTHKETSLQSWFFLVFVIVLRNKQRKKNFFLNKKNKNKIHIIK